MPSILKETTRRKIFSLASDTLAKAQEYLKTFHTTSEYKELISTHKAELSDEDIICLALSRKAEDTNKIDVKRLGEAIRNFHEPDDYNRMTVRWFFELCLGCYGRPAHYHRFFLTVPDDVVEGFKAVIFIALAMNFSKQVLPVSERNAFNMLTAMREYSSTESMRQKRGYINLSGMDLKNVELYCLDLSDADLSDTDLSGANINQTCFNRSLLLGTHFSGATLFSMMMHETRFDPDKLMKADFSKSCHPFNYFLKWKPDQNELFSELDFLHQQGLKPDLHNKIFEQIVHDLSRAIRSGNFPYETKMELVARVMNHPLFGNQTKLFTFTSAFFFGIDTVPLIQKKLYELKNAIRKDQLTFMARNAKTLDPEPESEQLLHQKTFFRPGVG